MKNDRYKKARFRGPSVAPEPGLLCVSFFVRFQAGSCPDPVVNVMTYKSVSSHCPTFFGGLAESE